MNATVGKYPFRPGENLATIFRRGCEVSVYFSMSPDRLGHPDRPGWERNPSRDYLTAAPGLAAEFFIRVPCGCFVRPYVPRPGVEPGRKNAFVFIPRGKTRFNRI